MAPKSEFRSPKSERNPKPEGRRPQPVRNSRLRNSEFGLLSDFGLRNSDFTFRGSLDLQLWTRIGAKNLAGAPDSDPARREAVSFEPHRSAALRAHGKPL